MQDGESCKLNVRALANLSSILAGLMLILLGSLISMGILLPIIKNPAEVLNLNMTWQVPSVLICSLLFGARKGIIITIAYLTIGLFFIPIFQNGGNLNYLQNPGFGYLIGFIPAAWITGRLSQQKGMNNILNLSIASILGLFALHICGITNLILGSLSNQWQESFIEILFSYSIAPITSQIIVCPAIALITIVFRKLLFIT